MDWGVFAAVLGGMGTFLVGTTGALALAAKWIGPRLRQWNEERLAREQQQDEAAASVKLIPTLVKQIADNNEEAIKQWKAARLEAVKNWEALHKEASDNNEEANKHWTALHEADRDLRQQIGVINEVRASLAVSLPQALAVQNELVVGQKDLKERVTVLERKVFGDE